MSEKPKELWSHCNECNQETKHDSVHQANRQRSFAIDGCYVDVGSVWDVLQCRGCGEIALRRIDWCSEDDPRDGPGPTTYFPPRVSRRKPAWASRYDLPWEYLSLLEETYTALHSDSRRLAMMGARALIDAVIRRNAGEQPNFAQGLNALSEKYLISEQDRGIIEAAIEAGSASAHRGHDPSPEDVNVVIDIVERLIHTEILAKQALKLKESTPPRPKRTAQKKS
ncbi:MAG: DUF4145 domain-containing protein [Candidatus Sumerlaeaceae bacterium]|nr:DUF4145 domain-containing protein [Candidatus Sumerlaeaceae bacterium]